MGFRPALSARLLTRLTPSPQKKSYKTYGTYRTYREKRRVRRCMSDTGNVCERSRTLYQHTQCGGRVMMEPVTG